LWLAFELYGWSSAKPENHDKENLALKISVRAIATFIAKIIF